MENSDFGSETGFALELDDETRPPIDGTKRCPFCGCWHSKRNPAVYCSPDHAKRSQRQAGWVLRLLKRAARRSRQERAYADHWRDVIYGDKAPSLPGAAPPEPAQHGRRRVSKPHPAPAELEADTPLTPL